MQGGHSGSGGCQAPVHSSHSADRHAQAAAPLLQVLLLRVAEWCSREHPDGLGVGSPPTPSCCLWPGFLLGKGRKHPQDLELWVTQATLLSGLGSYFLFSQPCSQELLASDCQKLLEQVNLRSQAVVKGHIL